jgi:23S rRNA (adenine2503-C2)-methyltransferase
MTPTGVPSDLIHSLSRDEIVDVCSDLGFPRFRADQLWRWLYVQRVRSWDAMINLPEAARRKLAAAYSLDVGSCIRVAGKANDTRKLLVELQDGECVESVLIPADAGPRARRTVCISSQVGCRFACVFCASGQSGFRRNLEAGEMVGQVLLAAEVLKTMPTHVVFMGIGEPFDNIEAVLKAARLLNDADGLCMGARRITISTAGVVPGIERLAETGIQFELSVSLHAPTQDLRSRLMPISRTYPLDDLIAAGRAYTEQTGRIITFEYTLIRDVNDGAEQARALAGLLGAFPCRVNLIPLSPVDEYDGAASTPDTATMFIDILSTAGLNATLRASRGCPLQAACGQLRAREKRADREN